MVDVKKLTPQSIDTAEMTAYSGPSVNRWNIDSSSGNSDSVDEQEFVTLADLLKNKATAKQPKTPKRVPIRSTILYKSRPQVEESRTLVEDFLIDKFGGEGESAADFEDSGEIQEAPTSKLFDPKDLIVTVEQKEQIQRETEQNYTEDQQPPELRTCTVYKYTKLPRLQNS